MKEIRRTDIVSIFKATGEKIDEVRLPEKIMPIPAKRGGFSEGGIYYKGSGIVYRNHLTNELMDKTSGSEKIIGQTGLVYEKYLACYTELVGRFGIFAFPHQPIFTDYEGGCGRKEQRLIINQEIFERSAIEEIIDVIPTGIAEHNIYAYRLKAVKGGIEDTILLIEYVLTNDFATAWDKNLWEDIYAFGYVRDVADWFVSGGLNHKIGTVYALLNSLYRADLSLYAQLLLKYFGMYSFEKYKILYYAALLVERYCPKLLWEEELNLKVLDEGIYERLLSLLFGGKACCHLEDEEKWRWVYEYYEGLKGEAVGKFRKVRDEKEG